MQFLVTKVVASLVFILCAVWYGQAHFYRDPGSAFFDERRAYEQRYSSHRKAQVRQYIDSRATADAQPKAGANASLCVTLSSVKRQHAQYLKTAIGSLLCGLSPRERADLDLNVLVAETDPSKHPSWRQKWVLQAVDDMYSYNVSSEKKSHLEKLERTGVYVEKGVFDYVYALRHCYETGRPYIGMFEDDIMLADGWLVRALLGLRQIASHRDDWLLMRLFNQERSTGWANRHIGGNHEFWIILGIGVGIALPASIARRRWRLARIYLDPATICALVLIINPGLVILFFQAGKASMLPPSPGVFREEFGCCSQAMIFPREQVPLLIDFLEHKQRGQVDLLLGELAREAGLAQYALYPVQAQHIGLDSARATEKQEAQAIWSMAYEDLNPAVLDRAHRNMIKEYYG